MVRQLLTDKEVAFLYPISVSTLRHARSDRPDIDAPPFIREGRRCLYPLPELRAWAERLGLQALGPSGERE